MLTPEQEKFLQYWAANRDKEKKLLRQARAGLPLGLSFSAAILVCVFSGWYTRAMMELSTDVSPVLLIIAVLLIAITCSIFSQKQKWEMNEQSYLELLAKLKRENKDESAVQAPNPNTTEKGKVIENELNVSTPKKDTLNEE
jgi:F0F1-type ATP synthase assembly protein I